MGTVPTIPSLLTAITGALASLPSNLTTASAGADVFEGYALSIVLQAAVAEGATVTFQNRDLLPCTSAIFRTSPGHLYSEAQNYSHAVIAFPAISVLEAHLGVYLTGRSQLIHEADVVVLLSSEAAQSRANSVPPRSYACILTVECKFYADNISLALGRGFVGLCSDLSADKSFFVTNSGSLSVEKLLTHKHLGWASQLRPSQTVVVNRLRNEIQAVFKDYKAKHA